MTKGYEFVSNRPPILRQIGLKNETQCKWTALKACINEKNCSESRFKILCLLSGFLKRKPLNCPFRNIVWKMPILDWKF